MLQITKQRTTTPWLSRTRGNLGFGVHYTDHMLIIDHDEEKGWHDARIVTVSAARARSRSDGFPLRNGVL